jgi:hypothetical protein
MMHSLTMKVVMLSLLLEITLSTVLESRPAKFNSWFNSDRSSLLFDRNGYSQYTWRGHTINYIDAGDTNTDKPAILLIHGFGASSYHWRYNIPELSKSHHVFAFDLLGFGLSDKPILEYEVDIWRHQILDFIHRFVLRDCVVVGNSLGVC